MNNKLFAAGIALVIIIAIASYYYGNPLTTVNVPLTSLQEELDVTKLDNGMLVTIKEMHTLPLVTIQFWVHTGGRNEPEELKGIAHIFEHMVQRNSHAASRKLPQKSRVVGRRAQRDDELRLDNVLRDRAIRQVRRHLPKHDRPAPEPGI